MVQLNQSGTHEVDEAMIRHFVLNIIRSYNSKFRQEYGKLIIACDARHTWRRDIFPYYKQNRRDKRAESKIDWKKVFRFIDQTKEDLKEHFPFPVIEVDGAEGDDVIGVLAEKFGTVIGNDPPLMIISSDKDYRQLQRWSNVRQWHPLDKKFLTVPDPEAYLRELIMDGDKSDGVPNVLSNDDTLVLRERSKSMTKERLAKLLVGDYDLKGFSAETLRRNVARNETLIDLRKTPTPVVEKILESFEAQQDRRSANLVQYFMKHRLKQLMEKITEFDT